MPLVAPISTPPFLEGDSLTSDEFLRLWKQEHDLKYAELIDGIVYMPSPLSRSHANCEVWLANWLGHYAAATPGCSPSMEATWIMGDRQVPQPDLTLRILPEYGGQSGLVGDYHSGAPELIVEVAVSSRSRDFGAKKRLYEKMGVREYLIVVPREQEFLGLSLTSGSFQHLGMKKDGIFRSLQFPCLWLDLQSIWKLDLPRMFATLQQGLATPEHFAYAAQLASQKR